MANEKQEKRAKTRTERNATRGVPKVTSGRDAKRQTEKTHGTKRKGNSSTRPH